VPSISPFTGLLFDPARVGPLQGVTAPPYDAVTAEQERRLHAASPYNVVRLILGRDEAGDDAARNKYTRAASRLRAWEQEGVLVEAPGVSWYPYEMRFHFQGGQRRVRGLICQVELESWGGSIIPHEEILPAPFEDRLALLRQTHTNLSAVYALFRGPSPALAEHLEEATAAEPAGLVVDEEGVEHRMWLVEAERAPDIPAWLADEPLLIADGHHRYSVALAFRDEMRSSHGPGPWDHMLMFVVDAGTEEPPVLPIHRVVLDGHVPVEGERVRDLAEVLASLSDDDLAFGVAAREDGAVTHRVGRLAGRPPTVCALHEQVLGDAGLRFLHDAALAEEMVHRGEAPAAFFLPPTRVERIRSVIERGERLPQKSTYFWPKPRTGMVFRPLR
jgi:uncharacterized protein (DUF1015 family)